MPDSRRPFWGLVGAATITGTVALTTAIVPDWIEVPLERSTFQGRVESHRLRSEFVLVIDIEADRLLAAIKPQKGESPWREVPWLTNVTEARRRASAENKPLVIFTAADGSPLSRT